MTLLEEAHVAWAKRAEREAENRKSQLGRLVSPLIHRRSDEYEINTDFFDDQVQPLLRVGADVDGITFCLNKDGHLCCINWRCSHKGCTTVNRKPISDLASIGKAFAEGATLEITQPDCGGHGRFKT